MISPGWYTPLLVLALLAASFFFSGTETGYFSLQKPERERFANGTLTQRQVTWLLARRSALITTILLGNETANVWLAATTGPLLSAWAPNAPWLNIVVLTPVVVLLSEITPKVLAYRFRRIWAQVAAWPFTAWYWIATPFRLLFSGIVAAVARLVGAEARDESLAEEELMVYVDHGTAAGELEPHERDIIEAVFEFDDLTVERLMTPRPDVFALPLGASWDEIVERTKGAGFSRIPITGVASDDILGVLLLKDLLKFRQQPLAGPKQLRSMLLPPVFVPSSKSADSMLREFLERRFHMAFVVDEHGTFVGLVTLDDLLAELLGEDDETFDTEIARLRPDALTVKASIDVDDFVEETGIELPAGDYHTLGGYVFHALGRLPRKGDHVTHGEHRFVVAKMEGRRIAELIVTGTATPMPAADRGEAAG